MALIHFGLTFLWYCICLINVVWSDELPNIIFLLIDDLGWNDVSYHGGSDFLTPHLDALQSQAVRLTNYYVQHYCTPTRSALMSGRYPIRDGLQQWIIRSAAPYGMPLDILTMPEILQSLGYSTHMLGKWHLGYYDSAYTPTNRGFDTFYGYYGDKEDYFSKNNSEWSLVGGDKLAAQTTTKGSGNYGMIELKGLDFRHGTDTFVTDQYSTWFYGNETMKMLQNVVESEQKEPFFLYWSSQAAHTPFQAPQDKIDSLEDSISCIKRRRLAAVVSLLDDTIGEMVEYLQSEESGNMWDNTVLIVSTDNGGDVTESASNFPLRGGKKTLWEGGVKATAFVTGGWIDEERRDTDMEALMHVTDWMPTILSFAGKDSSHYFQDGDIDGENQAQNILEGETDPYSPREEILLNVLPMGEDGSCARSVCGAIRYRNYKLLIGRDLYMKVDDGVTPDNDPEDQLCLNGWCDKTESASLKENTHSISCTPKGNYVYPVVSSSNCLLDGTPCLFDLTNDPCEYHDLHDTLSYLSTGLIWKLERYHLQAQYPLFRDFPENGTRANPLQFGGYWSPWIKPLEVESVLHPDADVVDDEDDEKVFNVHNAWTSYWWAALLPVVIVPVAVCILVTMEAHRKRQGIWKRDGYSQIEDASGMSTAL